MTGDNEYEKAQMLLREAKPSWLGRMDPQSPIAPSPVPERPHKFDMGITPIAIDGSSTSGGGDQAGALTAIVLLRDGILYYATVTGTIGDPVA